MRNTLGAVIVLGLFATAALAVTANVDYAHDFDFEKVKTFQYVETADSNMSDSLMDRRIKDGIIEHLTTGGLKQVDSEPDIFVTYHVTTEESVVFTTTGYGYGGYGMGWRGYGMGMGGATTTSSTFTEGTLIIDAYGPDDKTMVWRGTGTVTLKAKPEKQAKQIDKILTKMGAKWDKILANKGE